MSTQPYFEAVARQMPQARYVLPDFEERTAYGFRRQNPYTKLFEDRIVFLGVQVDDAVRVLGREEQQLRADHVRIVIADLAAQPDDAFLEQALVDRVAQSQLRAFAGSPGIVHAHAYLLVCSRAPSAHWCQPYPLRARSCARRAVVSLSAHALSTCARHMH